ncbi:GNAT family N-acetyltransferase [Bifidobacterium choerinum]|uniref:Acetyltransferase n=1 Tax=Bifidobacterium choerinum TaxID=35760 RepID=A0A087AI66_9BIFI|nr:GNAT family N-acetyltransferase [Bifidobacterium choerinum]KFI58466.1 acetyltransferase [Bifidobacterium choerinum]
MHLTIQQDTLTPELFLTLYRSVGWDAPGIDQMHVALANSTATVTAYAAESEADPEPVSMVRLIGDGGMSFYVKDFAVVPAMQSQGVGAALIDALERHVRSLIEPGWAVSLELISSQGAVAFYERHGFERRPNDWDGPGMFTMIRA